ncbi:MAG: DUF1697 domain-containing protein [Vicingaceae bacterium]
MNFSYTAFFRGINVGGHHKVPMQELKKQLESLKFENVTTLLNSGNVLFNTQINDTRQLEQTISVQLEGAFGFPIPTMVIPSEMIRKLIIEQPFKRYELTKDKRFYISILSLSESADLKLPWKSEDNSYQIIEKRNRCILSVLDLSISGSPEAMASLERIFGKDVTTRNWNTIERIGKKLSD